MDPATTDYSLFEGLFVRVLKPDAEFAEQLKAAGYDPRNPKARYPTSVWQACLAVTHQRLYPGMLKEEAYRRIGALFLEGFFNTIIGRVIQVAMPFLGPMRVLHRMQKNMQMVRTQIAVKVTELSPISARLDVEDLHGEPDFVAGYLEVGSRQTGVTGKAEVVQRSPQGFSIVVSWQPK